jgi:hypothetical protein
MSHEMGTKLTDDGSDLQEATSAHPILPSITKNAHHYLTVVLAVDITEGPVLSVADIST